VKLRPIVVPTRLNTISTKHSKITHRRSRPGDPR
jgi:hypothetical protein